MTVMFTATPFWADNWQMNLKRTVRYYYLKFTRLQGNPQSLATGTAIGIFLGLVPITPFHTVSVLFVTFLTRTSTIAGMLATVMVCNPLTYVPQYYFSLVIGNILTPYEISWERMQSSLDTLLSKPAFSESLTTLANLGYEVIIVLLVGGTVFALPFTVIGYFLSLHLFIKVREKRNKKHILA